jgi:plasmid stabilization system protein ParE
MAKQIIWSFKAQTDRKGILHFWATTNQSKTYSRKLSRLFQEAVKLIAQHPNIGTPTEFGQVRSKVVRNYQIFYEEIEDTIHILTIWDSRQAPDKLPNKFQ